MMPDAIFIPFVFALGACIGSFLNVVVYRLPREISLITPPSRCPDCETPLAWYDNIPVFGWIFLRGKCRYCKKPISPCYPVVEAITGFLFVFYYVMFFILHAGPCRNLAAVPGLTQWFVGDLTDIREYWPIYSLYMMLISGLLAASLIDAELFIIPASIPWWIAGVAIVAHAIIDRPGMPGALIIGPAAMSLTAGAGLGLLISIVLLHLRVLPMSFPLGDLLEHERSELNEQVRSAKEKGEAAPEVPPEFTPRQIRAEMRKEMLFLMPPLALGGVSLALHIYIPSVQHLWQSAAKIDWLNGGLGSLLGALIGTFVVWMTRIAGSFGFGKEAMGLGDVHLMFAVGAVLGGGAAAIAFFIAPFFGIALAIYMMIRRSGRQLPYGPYLSLATAFIMLFYCPIAAYLRPGMMGLLELVRMPFSGS
ncbi:MAG: prepilin peptidase [Planctomycetota bacterium]|nr:prepilin peptidase [Planctomycetota bacterium]